MSDAGVTTKALAQPVSEGVTIDGAPRDCPDFGGVDGDRSPQNHR
jgi:hypothetical protein